MSIRFSSFYFRNRIGTIYSCFSKSAILSSSRSSFSRVFLRIDRCSSKSSRVTRSIFFNIEDKTGLIFFFSSSLSSSFWPGKKELIAEANFSRLFKFNNTGISPFWLYIKIVCVPHYCAHRLFNWASRVHHLFFITKFSGHSDRKSVRNQFRKVIGQDWHDMCFGLVNIYRLNICKMQNLIQARWLVNVEWDFRFKKEESRWKS